MGCKMWDLNEIVCRVETSHALMLNRDDDPGPTNDKDIAVVFPVKDGNLARVGRSWDS